MTRTRAAAVFALFFTPSLAAAAGADVTVRVNPDGGGDYTSVSEALDNTDSGDIVTVELESGVYAPFAVARPGVVHFTTVGNEDDTILRGIDVVEPTAQVTVTGMQIVEEGADVVRGELTLEAVRFANPGTSGQPAVRIGRDATAHLDMVLVEGWNGAEAPIMAGPNATATFDMVGVFNSEGARAGAILSRNANLDIHTLLTIDTRAGSGAGALNIDGGTVALVDSRIEGASGILGGGLRIAGEAAVTATDLVLQDNDALDGGHIRVESGTLDMVRVTATGGAATYGGVIWQGDGAVTIRNANFNGNHALTAGAGIYQQGGTFSMAFGTWTELASNGGAAAHTGSSAAAYDGVIIADTEGAAFNVAADADITFTDGLIWEVGATTAVIGDLDYNPNTAYAPPRFADARSDDYALRATSEGLDIGVAGKLDLDGTAADAGMYGGPAAWPLADLDGDGFVHGRDCVDVNAGIHEGAPDRFYDGIDSNCDELSDYDQDGDGYDATLFAGGDCDDTNPAVYPDAVEEGGDALDVDCDGFDFPDADADGWPADLDCDDSSADIAPDAEDPWYDDIDQDCAGNNDFDQDGDGYESMVYGGRDCDDTNPNVHPMYPDYAGDGIDQDCDGQDAVEEAAAEDEVTELQPYTEVPGTAPAAMGAEDTRASASTSTGCSSTGSSGGGPLGLLGVLGLMGLVARRKD